MDCGIEFPFRTIKTHAHPHTPVGTIYMCFGFMTNVNEEENTFSDFVLHLLHLGSVILMADFEMCQLTIMRQVVVCFPGLRRSLTAFESSGGTAVGLSLFLMGN